MHECITYCLHYDYAGSVGISAIVSLLATIILVVGAVMIKHKLVQKQASSKFLHNYYNIMCITMP